MGQTENELEEVTIFNNYKKKLGRREPNPLEVMNCDKEVKEKRLNKLFLKIRRMKEQSKC